MARWRFPERLFEIFQYSNLCVLVYRDWLGLAGLVGAGWEGAYVVVLQVHSVSQSKGYVTRLSVWCEHHLASLGINMLLALLPMLLNPWIRFLESTDGLSSRTGILFWIIEHYRCINFVTPCFSLGQSR